MKILALVMGLLWVSSSHGLSPKPISLHIELDRSLDSSPMVVKLQFSESVRALDFSATPYALVSQDWHLLQKEASLNHSSLAIDLQEPQKQLAFEVTRTSDDFIRGFYTPFLKFSDGGRAVFVGHYIPKRIETHAGWLSSEEIDISLTIKARDETNILFSGQRNVTGYEMIAGEGRQYAYIGSATPQDKGAYSVVFDPKLPEWIRAAYSQDGAKIFRQYELKTRARLPFKPLFLVSFNDGDVAPRFDGGAIGRQIAINFVGEGWKESVLTSKVSILRLWAHEVAHFWNSQLWRAEGRGAVWLTEGGANFLARAVLLELGYISDEQFLAQSEKQVSLCSELLTDTTVDGLRSRADKYICGEAIFYLAASKQGGEYNAFDFWNEVVHSASGPAYTVHDFIAALEQSDVSEQQRVLLRNVVMSVPGSMLEPK